MSDTLDFTPLQDRIDDIRKWLLQPEQAPVVFDEQLHITEGTRERVYWHYGYQVAIGDVLAYLTGDREPSRSSQDSD